MTKEEYIQNRIAELGDFYRSHTTSKSDSDKIIAMECGDWPKFRGNTSFEFTLELLLECKYTESEIVNKLNDKFPDNKNNKRPRNVLSVFSGEKCRNVKVYRENGVIGLKWDRYKLFSEYGDWKNYPERTPTFEGRLDEFHEQVKISIRDTKNARERRLRKAQKAPTAIIIETRYFPRNPDVVAEVLLRANGICERCNKNAPFIRIKDGTPYLEVHHKVQLANGGEDTVENAIALCPNCHRYLHYGYSDT